MKVFEDNLDQTENKIYYRYCIIDMVCWSFSHCNVYSLNLLAVQFLQSVSRVHFFVSNDSRLLAVEHPRGSSFIWQIGVVAYTLS